MKTIIIILLIETISLIGFAQPSILITPENGVVEIKDSYSPNHKIKVQTQTGEYGFLQKGAGTSQVGTCISSANGGYASYGTLSNHNLLLTTNLQNAQVVLNTSKFMGIGGTPFSALHVYGDMKIAGLNSPNLFLTEVKTDNDGKLNMAPQTYYYSIPRSAFLPVIRSGANSTAESDAGGIYYTVSQGATDVFEAPINLPPGSKITGIEFYFIDNSNANLTAYISYRAFGNPFGADFLPFLTSSGVETGIRSLVSNNVNNGTGIPVYNGAVYYISILCFDNSINKAWDGENTQLVAAKIIYTY